MKRPVSSINLEDFGINTLKSANALDTPSRILQYCKDMNLINDNVTDIESLINQNKELELIYKDLGHLDAAIEKLDDDKFLISINSNHPRKRQRFSMAHEYAHYQLHRAQLENLSGGEKIMHRSAERDSKEYQANRLAGEILMPQDSFLEICNQLDNKAYAIAEAFDVSMDAARMRAKQLGLMLNE